MAYHIKSVSINEEQSDFIERNSINLSRFLQLHLNVAMIKEAKSDLKMFEKIVKKKKS